MYVCVSMYIYVYLSVEVVGWEGASLHIPQSSIQRNVNVNLLTSRMK